MRTSEPATNAYNAIDDLKWAITDLTAQRDTWMTRYGQLMEKLAATEHERDYWRQVVFDRGDESIER